MDMAVFLLLTTPNKTLGDKHTHPLPQLEVGKALNIVSEKGHSLLKILLLKLTIVIENRFFLVSILLIFVILKSDSFSIFPKRSSKFGEKKHL